MRLQPFYLLLKRRKLNSGLPSACESAETATLINDQCQLLKTPVLLLFRASLLAQLVKNPPAMRETWVRSLGWEDPLEEGLLFSR